MRHNKNFNHLGRQSAHRKALLANMATSLILHKRISTTIAKAKALKGYVEPLVTRSKEDSTHSRRVVFSYLKDKHAVSELFREVAPRIANRPGGYTRILKTGFRVGDAADMCIIELVDFNEGYSASAPATTKPKTRRSRGGGGAKTLEATVVAEDAAVEGGESAAEAAPAADRKAPAKAAQPKAPAKVAMPKGAPKAAPAKSTHTKKG
ncbi:MAG: 50S ribosomal protein L17 [Rikenellaceae bacterium]|jgi:large subunit ribosomal protein L17|nr:50S ribosomal protein L17 [Rikenellaceae bacterium]